MVLVRPGLLLITTALIDSERLALRLYSDTLRVVFDVIALGVNLLRSRSALAAENLFFRKQLTFFVERDQTPRRTDNATRFAMATLSRLFEWSDVLVVVKPDTLIRWHSKGFRLFCRCKSQPKGRPTVSVDLQKLSCKWRHSNVTWGEERIAHELLVKLEIRVSPRTVRKYMPARDDGGRGPQISSHRWTTFFRNHAKALIAADFLTGVTARFHLLYVFVVMEISSRKVIQFNVTVHPRAEWTSQQFREAIPCEHDYRFLIVDRYSRFSDVLRKSVRAIGVKARPPDHDLRSPCLPPKLD